MRLWEQVRAAVAGSLIDRVERDHGQPERQLLRRRVVVGAFLVIGAVLLTLSLGIRPATRCSTRLPRLSR